MKKVAKEVPIADFSSRLAVRLCMCGKGLRDFCRGGRSSSLIQISGILGRQLARQTSGQSSKMSGG